MIGIVACEALYPLVERFASDAPVRYIAAELHEFPINVPLDDDITDRVQAAVDDLSGTGLDAIAVSYARAGDGLVGVSSSDTPLLVSRLADCTSTLLPDRPTAYGETKAPGTLYLTRGWIDCGIDSYKLYMAYNGEIEALRRRFEAARNDHPSLRVTWPDGERFARAVDRSRTPSPSSIDRFFHSVVRHYDTVALVDTDDLLDLHHEYAETVRDFIERLRREHGTEGDVELERIEGVTDRFRSLVTGEGAEFVDRYDPGDPIDGPT